MRQEKEVEIGGKKRLIKFGTNASAIFCEKYNIPLSKLNDILSFTNVRVDHIRGLIWSGLVAGARKKKEDVDFDEWEVGDWIDETDQETVEEIYKLMNPDQEVVNPRGKAKAEKS